MDGKLTQVNDDMSQEYAEYMRIRHGEEATGSDRAIQSKFCLLY